MAWRRRAMPDETYLDPTDSVAVPRRTAPRPSSLDGKVVTLLDIGKAQGRGRRAQAEALGATDYRTVVVPHPIQPLTRGEVQALADEVFDEILLRLTS